MDKSKQDIQNSKIGNSIRQSSDATDAEQVINKVSAEEAEQIVGKSPTLKIGTWQAKGIVAIVILAAITISIVYFQNYASR